MRFALTDGQTALRDAVHELLADECAPDVVRAAGEAPPGELDRGVWTALDDMGVLTVLVPEDEGGLGLDEVSLVPILVETGRVALPFPVVETAMVVAPLAPAVVIDAGPVVAASLGEGTVPWGADADALVIEVDPPPGSHGPGHALHLLEPDRVTLEPADGVDHSRRHASIVDMTLGWDSVLTDDIERIDAAFDRGALGTAAQLVGLGERMLEMTVEYVKERRQFGAPVGSFQAVQHQLADARLQLEFARPAVLRAAWTMAERTPTVERDVSMAKALASAAATLAGRAALQCHGAVGYTVEHDLHLFLKRAWALSRAFGDAAWHRDRVGRALGV
jgi:alkylation response protein AidB-like acyl-CoA dehydrogenase